MDTYKTFINVAGVMKLTRLQFDFEEDDFYALYQLPIDSDEPKHVKKKYYRTSIKTDVVDSYHGVLYFPSLPNEDIIPSEADQTFLDILGSISFVTENAFGIGFVIVVASHRTPVPAALPTAGTPFVIVDGLYRRIQDSEGRIPPIFEFHLQNSCIYRDRKDNMLM